MPTFIKTGFWESSVKSYKGWLNLEELIINTVPPQATIYTSNGTLTGNRTLSSGGYSLTLNAVTNFGDNVYIPDASKYLFIGTNQSVNAFGHKIRAVGQGDASIAIFRNQASSSPAKLEFFRSRGTYLAPTASSANDQLMNIAAFGWGSAATQYTNAAAISIIAESIGATGIQGKINFTTYNNTGGNFVNLSLKNSFSAPGSGGCSVFSASIADTITPLGTLHVRGFDATAANNALYVENSSQTQLAKLSNDGQLLIGTGAFTGQRLQVYGDAFIKGSGATSATSALVLQNSTGAVTFSVNNAGSAYLVDIFEPGRVRTNLVEAKINQSITIQAPWAANNTIFLQSWESSDTSVRVTLTANNTRTAGFHTLLSIGENFVPTSGNASFQNILINPTINQTGGANGVTRGIYIAPTLTAAADFRAIETTTGKVIFGNLPTSSAGLPSGAIWNNAGVVNIVP